MAARKADHPLQRNEKRAGTRLCYLPPPTPSAGTRSSNGVSMSWTAIARREHNRDVLRFPSDLKDREWALIKPLIPPARRGGRRRATNMRSVAEAILYIASSGCQWRILPGDFPPVSIVRGYFYAWRAIGLWQRINQLLVMAAREIEGREAQPSGHRCLGRGIPANHHRV
ncbi:putative insertion sequence transposase protein (plasmid) [Rhizobium etli CFN 42]|uniref:Insertion sequence transposase protein n=1 Tax=Rhizobium etli (strain ATCC 51251 / DSM 11541 / JCM 21823 / NBRC 15573 / CFN 42) TaxID=347834 RepID=Q2K2J6_RHIEC|nr:putative insertion sequence transposase protein [Rhizobium etli CFN 42]